MASFMFIPRDREGDFADASPSEMQALIEKYIAWTEQLGQEGKIKGQEKLRDGAGRVIRGEGGKVTVTDGPFSEAKEIIGGYWLIDAADYDEAVELARTCPAIEYGSSLEIREIEPL